MTGVTIPPDDDTRRTPVVPLEKRIVSSGPHEAPRLSGTFAAITCEGPPLAGVFFSLPSAK